MLITVEMKSVMNKVSAGYVLTILRALYVLTASVLHVHNDLIIIQKLILMHTHIHIHTQNSEVLFTKSIAAIRQQTVGSSGAAAPSRSCGGSSWVACTQQQLDNGGSSLVRSSAGGSSINSKNAYYNNW